MTKQIDFIIVGLGLAGACLALQLLKRGKRIMVYDLPGQNRASSIAAGLFNPVTGKRVVKTWKADEVFQYLFDFYTEAEKKLDVKFFHPTSLYMPFRSIEEQNDWMSRSNDPAFVKYVESIKTSSTFSDEVKDPLGGILLSSCGYIDSNVLLESLRALLTEKESYREERWDDEKLIVGDDKIVYCDLKADKIIYCTGIHMLQSKYFTSLPLKPLKGEVITISTRARLHRMYNRGVYVIESNSNMYKVGATYDLTNLTERITTSGRDELETKTNELLNVPFEIAHQDWGIRPSTIDRRPLLGEHPEMKNILIFNGLGTKGVSLAPYFSGQLTEHLLGKGKLDQEANINRVKSLYSGFQ